MKNSTPVHMHLISVLNGYHVSDSMMQTKIRQQVDSLKRGGDLIPAIELMTSLEKVGPQKAVHMDMSKVPVMYHAAITALALKSPKKALALIAILQQIQKVQPKEQTKTVGDSAVYKDVFGTNVVSKQQEVKDKVTVEGVTIELPKQQITGPTKPSPTRKKVSLLNPRGTLEM